MGEIMGIKIITDSTSDFSQQQAKELNVTILPLKVIFSDGEYSDGIDLLPDEFYQKLAQSATLPTTSQLTPEQFLPHFEAAKSSNDDVLVITLSSMLSGTYQSAVIAKDMAEYDNIYIIDSATVTLGLQILVRKAIDLVKKGLEIKALVDELEQAKQRIRLFALVESLEYLKKGGRLTGVSALAGTILNIKPIIEVKDGVVGVAAKARGMSGAYSKLVQLTEQSGPIDYEDYICTGYSKTKTNMETFLTYSKDSLELGSALESPIGIVVGTHAGPGVCGIAYFQKK